MEDQVTESVVQDTPESTEQAVETTEQATEQTTEETTEKPSAPESYEDFVMPDGLVFDRESSNDLLVTAKEFDLTQEQTQKIVDLYTSRVAAQQKAQAIEVEQMVKESKKIHGEEGLKEAIKARDYLLAKGKITQKFHDLMNNPLIGNNPEMISILRIINTETKEAQFVDSNNSTAGKSAAEILYPSMKK